MDLVELSKKKGKPQTAFILLHHLCLNRKRMHTLNHFSGLFFLILNLFVSLFFGGKQNCNKGR